MPTPPLPRLPHPPDLTLPTHKNVGAALLRHGNVVYWARGPALKPGYHTPETPVSRLIQGLYERYPSTARRMVRNRIFMTGERTPYCDAVMRVAAKRLSEGLPPPSFGDGAEWEEIESVLPESLGTKLREPNRLSPLQAWQRCEELEAQVPKAATERFRADRPVAAVLLDAEGNVLGQATNAGSRNRTSHAEIGAVHAAWALTGKRIPAQATLFTTLKPCRMCAALVWWFCEDRTRLRIEYRDFDPGPQGRSTVLDAESSDRRRWAAPGEAGLVLQYNSTSAKGSSCTKPKTAL